METEVVIPCNEADDAGDKQETSETYNTISDNVSQDQKLLTAEDVEEYFLEKVSGRWADDVLSVFRESPCSHGAVKAQLRRYTETS